MMTARTNQISFVAAEIHKIDGIIHQIKRRRCYGKHRWTKVKTIIKRGKAKEASQVK